MVMVVVVVMIVIVIVIVIVVVVVVVLVIVLVVNTSLFERKYIRVYNHSILSQSKHHFFLISSGLLGPRFYLPVVISTHYSNMMCL